MLFAMVVFDGKGARGLLSCMSSQTNAVEKLLVRFSEQDSFLELVCYLRTISCFL